MRFHSPRDAVIATIALVACGAGVAYTALHHDKIRPTATPTSTSTSSPSASASASAHPVIPTPRSAGTRPTATPTPIEKILEQLPGFGQVVTAQQQEALHAASVRVARLKKQPGDEFATENLCTGIKVNIGGHAYVATARHCLVNGLDAIAEFPTMNTSRDPLHDPALHVPKLVPRSLGGKTSVWTFDSRGAPNWRHPIPVDRSVASYYPDMALLRIDETSPAARRFDALPAIGDPTIRHSKPVPGAQAVLYSQPMTSDTLLRTTGTYLGTSPYPADPSQEMAWVLMDGTGVAKDGCYFGASGSAAMIAGAGWTGPLATRIQPSDYAERYPERRDRRWRRMVAASLGLTLQGRQPALCGFGVVTPGSSEKMAQLAANP